MKKSLEKSKKILEEKRKNGQAKNLHKYDQRVYNNCDELRSRAIYQLETKKHRLCTKRLFMEIKLKIQTKNLENLKNPPKSDSLRKG